MARLMPSAVLVLAIVLLVRPGSAVPPPAAPAGTSVTLPYNLADSSGGNWTIFQNGAFRQQGNVQLYGQGAILMVNGNNVTANNNTARFDDKTNELVIENMAGQGCTVTRHIMFKKDDGCLRIIDIIKNTQAQELSANITLQSQINYGVQSGQTVTDPKGKNQPVGWVGLTTANNQAVAEVYAGKGAKVVPQIQYQQGNNFVQASITHAIAPGKEVAVMHLHSSSAGADIGAKWVAAIKEAKIMADIPSPLKKLILNFRSGVAFVGDVEVLRGDLMDIVEMRGDRGDKVSGTIKEEKFELKTFYGNVTVPADRVIGLLNVGEFHPRQLLVTREGEILGGELEKKELSIELSSKQMANVPVSQISRMGYRRKKDEPEEWTFEKPMVMLKSGERLTVAAPDAQVEVLTRYGLLKLKGTEMHALALQSEDSPVHQVLLADGSRISGLASAQCFDLKLSGANQSVKVLASAINRLQYSAKPAEVDDTTATMTLSNEDQLVGSLSGSLKLRTSFSSVTLSGPEVRHMSHGKTAGEVQVEMWDQTTLSGELEDQELLVKLVCGLEMKVPVGLVEEYNQPRPQPSAAVAESISKLAGELSAEDWNQRDEAQKKLVAMGPVVINVLKGLRDKQSPEGQQRIDQIRKDIETAEKAAQQPQTPPPDNGDAIQEAQPVQLQGVFNLNKE